MCFTLRSTPAIAGGSTQAIAGGRTPVIACGSIQAIAGGSTPIIACGSIPAIAGGLWCCWIVMLVSHDAGGMGSRRVVMRVSCNCFGNLCVQEFGTAFRTNQQLSKRCKKPRQVICQWIKPFKPGVDSNKFTDTDIYLFSRRDTIIARGLIHKRFQFPLPGKSPQCCFLPWRRISLRCTNSVAPAKILLFLHEHYD